MFTSTVCMSSSCSSAIRRASARSRRLDGKLTGNVVHARVKDASSKRGMRVMKRPGTPSSCPQCGRPTRTDADELQIAIEKGHVRRASRAADGVFEAAGGERPARGVVFMTAVLLIERLAHA